MLLLLRTCRRRQMGGLHPAQPPIFPGLFLGVLVNDIVIWFWIGSHDNYERLIRELR
jgi:hypothetical protein